MLNKFMCLKKKIIVLIHRRRSLQCLDVLSFFSEGDSSFQKCFVWKSGNDGGPVFSNDLFMIIIMVDMKSGG